jgi:hypothetical protein
MALSISGNLTLLANDPRDKPPKNAERENLDLRN